MDIVAEVVVGPRTSVAEIKVVNNPMAGGSSPVRVVREDTNAVVCPDYFARTRKLLRDGDGGKRAPLVIVSHLSVAVWIVGAIGTPIEGVMVKPGTGSSKDLVLSAMLMLCGFAAVQLAVLVEEMRGVVQPWCLEALGAGAVEISQSSYKGLQRLRWQTRLGQLGSFLLSFMLSFMVYYVTSGYNSPVMGVFLAGLCCSLLTALMIMLDFVLALEVGAVLTADAVVEVAMKVETVAPTDECWQSEVVAAALQLDTKHVGVLSRGFGRGLVAVYSLCWSIALMIFCYGQIYKFVESGSLLMAAVFLYIPMMISAGVAQVSTSCDDLMQSINACRIKDLALSDLLQRLELALR